MAMSTSRTGVGRHRAQLLSLAGLFVEGTPEVESREKSGVTCVGISRWATVVQRHDGLTGLDDHQPLTPPHVHVALTCRLDRYTGPPLSALHPFR